MLVVAEADIPRFYNDFYTFLSSCGIDSVKTDAQFMMDTWTSASARRSLTRTYLDSWTLSHLRHFGAKAISCMSQSPQILLYNQLPKSGPAIMCRNSDDFFPEVPASHPWHVWANAHNSLLTMYLNVVPDWDMFQTVHDYSAFHAAARCVSGGPVYITDVPGQHNLQLIGEMTGLSPKGRTVILRTGVGRSVEAYTGYHDRALLKVGSFHGFSSEVVGFLGVFNISPHEVTELIPVSTFPVAFSGECIVRAHSTLLISQPLNTDSLLTLTLPERGHEVLTAYPLTTLNTPTRGTVQVANLGLVGKITGAAAILSSHIELVGKDRICVGTKLKALGVLGIHVDCLAEIDVSDGLMVTLAGEPVPVGTVRKGGGDGRVLEVDVEAAWREMGVSSGEVEVRVFVML